MFLKSGYGKPHNFLLEKIAFGLFNFQRALFSEKSKLFDYNKTKEKVKEPGFCRVEKVINNFLNPEIHQEYDNNPDRADQNRGHKGRT